VDIAFLKGDLGHLEEFFRIHASTREMLSHYVKPN
jgi:hypothetical protein